jgi:hypothetical protein
MATVFPGALGRATEDYRYSRQPNPGEGPDNWRVPGSEGPDNLTPPNGGATTQPGMMGGLGLQGLLQGLGLGGGGGLGGTGLGGPSSLIGMLLSQFGGGAPKSAPAPATKPQDMGGP